MNATFDAVPIEEPHENIPESRYTPKTFKNV